jgi:hypothetical protein
MQKKLQLAKTITDFGLKTADLKGITDKFKF